jgi:hypothetical protein
MPNYRTIVPFVKPQFLVEYTAKVSVLRVGQDAILSYARPSCVIPQVNAPLDLYTGCSTLFMAHRAAATVMRPAKNNREKQSLERSLT